MGYLFVGSDGRNMIWFSIFAGLLAFFILRSAWKGGDLDQIIWKWFVRFIWLGSIAFFQALELERYLEGLTYRPFFGLYASLLFAAVVWFSAKIIRQRRPPMNWAGPRIEPKA